MNLLNKLTVKNLKLNKKRTAMTIIGIILSTALITAVAGMYSSAVASLIDFEINERGNFHEVFLNVPLTEKETFQNNRRIEKIFITENMGYAVLEDSQNEYKPYAYIKAYTKEAFDNLSINLIEGRLPQNENEIVIPEHLKTNGRVILNIGDIITLNIGERKGADGCSLYQSNPWNPENEEKIVNAAEKTYKIVGVISRPIRSEEPYSAPGYTFITYADNTDLSGNADFYVRFTKKGTKDYLRVTAGILGVDADLFVKVNSGVGLSTEILNKYFEEMENANYAMSANSYLIKLETNPIKESGVSGLFAAVVIVCVIIVFTSVFCIKNSFDISITEKIRQYGMLRSIGATKRQICKNVFYEAAVLGIIGIPLGILSGFLASYVLIIVSNYFMVDMINGDLNLKFKFSFLAVLAAVLLGAVTIYFSARRSAVRASKVSPVDSIRNSGEIKINRKNVKSPKIINKMFGIGGEISYKNIKRNKKKYRTTVISVAVSVFVFIALSYFMKLSFLSIENEYGIYESNISLILNVNRDFEGYEEILEKVTEVSESDNIKEYSVIRSKGYNVLKDGSPSYVQMYAVGDSQYKLYAERLGIKYDEAAEKGIFIDTQSGVMYNKGDILHGISADGRESEIDLEIACVTEKRPYGFKYIGGTIVIVSDKWYDLNVTKTAAADSDNSKRVSVERFEYYYYAVDPYKLEGEFNDILKDCSMQYSINNVEENMKAIKNFYILIGIFLYGFIIVITLIGITNIFNTITTNMQLRQREFAMLKSIGMTKKEFSRMIRLESIFMGAKSLIFGVPAGVILSYVMYHYLGEENGIKFNLPATAILISAAAVFVLITCIMKYSMSKINKQNTIETIRNENI